MKRRQQVKSENINCAGCGNIVPRKLGFYMYEYECCSLECIEPFRKEKQKMENARKGEDKYKGQSAFTFNTGGAY